PVTGGLADLFGNDKNFTGISAGQVRTQVQKNLNPVVVGTAESVALDGGQKLSSLNGGAGLSRQGESLTVDFDLDGNGNTATVSVTRDEILGALEGIGKNIGTATVDEYLGVLNSLVADKISQNSSLQGTSAAIRFGISDDLTGITVTSVSAPAGEDGLTVTVGGNLAGAGTSGIAAFGVQTGADFEVPDPYDIRGVTTTEATVSGVGYIRMEVDGNELILNTNGLDSTSTLDDLIRTLNSQLADAGYTDMSFGVSDSGTGLAFTNDSSDEVTFKYDDVSTLASDLGLCGTADEKTDTTVAANSHQNCSSLNRNYVDRSTLLSTLNNGKGADLGVITVTNAQGTSVHIDLADETTVGGVIDAINGLLTGVHARINDAGDGIIIEQTGNGTGSITVTNYDGNKTAEHLGIAGTSTAGEDGVQRLDGSMKTVISVSETDTLNDIMARISNLDAGYKASIINDGTGTNSYRLSISSGSTGAASDFIIDTDIEALTMQ
ncbi:MAG: hypothetical protein LIQ31_14705, partial [Planctomycetes bacterium]|nr:hypothetical protein [Planctomycetota bacterium]